MIGTLVRIRLAAVLRFLLRFIALPGQPRPFIFLDGRTQALRRFAVEQIMTSRSLPASTFRAESPKPLFVPN
jgi:hypothetical protein